MTDLYQRTKQHLREANRCDVPAGWPIFSHAGGDIAYNFSPFTEDKPNPNWKNASDYNSWQYDPTNVQTESVVSYSWSALGNYLTDVLENRMLYPQGVEAHHPLLHIYSVCDRPFIKYDAAGNVMTLGIDKAPAAWVPIDDDDSRIPIQMIRLLTSGANAFKGYISSGRGDMTQKQRCEIGKLCMGCIGMIPQTSKTPGLRTKSWAAQSAVNKLIAELTPYLLQPYASVSNPSGAGTVSNALAVGARSGPLGGIFISILMNDTPLNLSFDLRPYAQGNEIKIERITVLHGNVTRRVVHPAELSDYKVSYKPGQAELFVFQREPIQAPTLAALPSDPNTNPAACIP